MTGGTSKLVVEAYGNGNSKFPIRLYVYYKTSQSVEKNQSTITCGMYVTTPGGSYDIGSWQDNRGSYVGTTSNTFNGTIPNFSGTYWIAENKTFTVDHNDDGTGEATIYWKWGVYAYTSFVTGYQNPSGSFKITLPTIARASVPTLSHSSRGMGEILTIYTNQKSYSFTHTLSYTFAGETATIQTGVSGECRWLIPDLADKINNATSGTMTITCVTYNGSTKVGTKSVSLKATVPYLTVPSFPNGNVIIGSGNPITTNAGSKNFTHLITYSFNGKTGKVNEDKAKSGIVWWTPYDLASAIPNDTEGKGTITCTTYNGTAVVGSYDIPFTATVPDNSTTKPTFTEDNFRLTPTGSIPSTFSGLYIQGKTGVKASFGATSAYSTIASYKLSVDGKVYEGNPAESQALTKPDNIEVTGTVYDARGYYTSRPKTITVHPYFNPSIEPYGGYSSIICERSNGSGEYKDNGTYLHIRAKRKYAPVIVDGVQKNFCDLKYRYKVEGGGWSAYKTILLGSTSSTDEIEVVHTDVVTQTDKSYLVQLVVTDTMGASVPYDFPIGTDKVTLHLRRGGRGAAFGKYSEGADDLFECAWKAEFDKGVYGDTYGSHNGNVNGDTYGSHNGGVVGNVKGNVEGTVYGTLEGSHNNKYAADVLAFAMECQVGLTPFVTRQTSVNLPPEGQYDFSAGVVHRRSDTQINVYLTDYYRGTIATNTYLEDDGYGWLGWKYITLSPSTDTGWIELNSFTKYRRKHGFVTVSAYCDGDLTLTQNAYTTIGTLPVGYRPSTKTPIVYNTIGGSMDTQAGSINDEGKIELYTETAGKNYWAFSVTYPI